MLGLGSSTSGEIRIPLSGPSKTGIWELLCHPVKMNSSQTHLLTRMNLADLVRQVESAQQHLLVGIPRRWNAETPLLYAQKWGLRMEVVTKQDQASGHQSKDKVHRQKMSDNDKSNPLIKQRVCKTWVEKKNTNKTPVLGKTPWQQPHHCSYVC